MTLMAADRFESAVFLPVFIFAKTRCKTVQQVSVAVWQEPKKGGSRLTDSLTHSLTAENIGGKIYNISS